MNEDFEFIFKSAHEIDPQLASLAVVIRTQAPGALPNGTRVEKVGFEDGDSHEPGQQGTIIGSVGPHDYMERKEVYGYFVCWDDRPALPVFTASWKLREKKNENN